MDEPIDQPIDQPIDPGADCALAREARDSQGRPRPATIRSKSGMNRERWTSS